MPLTLVGKPKLKNPIINRIRNVTSQLFSYIRPEVILGIFLVCAILLAFLQIPAIGFYLVFGIFIAGYFCERIFIKIKKRE